MKKLLAVLLSVLCILGSFGTVSLAATEDVIGDVIGGILDVTQEEGPEEMLSYGIHYEMETLTLVKIMYKPAPTITFKKPVTAVISMDTPLSVDYEFVCWRHSETHELYYPGDPIEVDGVVTLYAVWEEKQDNYPSFIRYFITGVQVFKRLIDKFLGVIETTKEFEEEYFATTTQLAAN